MRIVLLILLLLMGTAQAEKVCKVYDADTLTLCNGVKVRLANVDAPELHQPYGKGARDFTRRYLIGRDVSLTCKGKSFKRRVCSVQVLTNSQRLDFGKELVGWGWAFSEPRYDKAGNYLPAEAFARNQRRGVWMQHDGGQRPWVYRKKKF